MQRREGSRNSCVPLDCAVLKNPMSELAKVLVNDFFNSVWHAAKTTNLL
jgi:hypothetical protein